MSEERKDLLKKIGFLLLLLIFVIGSFVAIFTIVNKDHEHKFEEESAVIVKPTCTEKGYTEYSCECGEKERRDYVDEIDHDYEDDICKNCGAENEKSELENTEDAEKPKDDKNIETETHTHVYKEKLVEATCTEQGYTRYTCDCKDTYKDNYKKALGHNFGKWITTKNPSTTYEGSAYRKCSRCGKQETKTLAKLVENHTHNYFEKIVMEPSCTKEGKKEFTCSCGASYTQILDKVSHNYKTSVVKPTCTEKGYTEHKCSVCGVYYKDNIEKALGHRYELKESISATCEKEGYKYYKCSRCGDDYKDVVDKLDHKYVSTKVEPTCTENGYTKSVCEVCEDEKISNQVEKLGHDYKEKERVDATCTKNGSVTYECVRKDASYTKSIDKLGHDIKTTRTEPTCTEDGKLIEECKKGDYIKETTLPATGHNYKDVSKAPTCTEDGLSGKKCDNCGDSDVKTENKLGHNYIETIVPPTCTEEGYTKHTCDRCGDEYIDNIVPELGHDYKVIEKTEPDCDKDGEEKQKCNNCDDIKITTIPSLGHDYKDTVVPPTTKEEGYTEHTCGNCGNSYKDTITPILGASFLERGIDFHIPDGTTKVVFTNTDAPEGVETEDVSMDGDNSVVAWSDGTTYMVSSQSKNNIIIANIDCDSMFLNVPTLSEIDFSNISFEQTESMAGMFAACKGLKTIDLSMIDTSNVVNMKEMFSQAGIKELDLTSWDISNVKNMVGMFSHCEELEKLDISTFETKNLTEAWGMFYCCYSLKDLQIKLDASKCKDINTMFCFCESLEQIDLTNFNTTGVEVMDALFANCYKLKELDVKHFDMSNVISADGMFEDCSMLEELDLSTWKTSKLENVSGMFSMCHELKTLDLTGWDVSSFDCVWQMFNNCENLETIYADDWSEKVSPCDKHAGRNERVFDSCDKLVGAVSFEETKTKNWSMANTQTGYFTLKPIE